MNHSTTLTRPDDTRKKIKLVGNVVAVNQPFKVEGFATEAEAEVAYWREVRRAAHTFTLARRNEARALLLQPAPPLYPGWYPPFTR